MNKTIYYNHSHVKLPKRGYDYQRATYCGIIKEGKFYIGVAVCSLEDQFNKKIGREIAHNRALNNPILIKEVSETET